VETFGCSLGSSTRLEAQARCGEGRRPTPFSLSGASPPKKMDEDGRFHDAQDSVLGTLRSVFSLLSSIERVTVDSLMERTERRFVSREIGDAWRYSCSGRRRMALDARGGGGGVNRSSVRRGAASVRCIEGATVAWNLPLSGRHRFDSGRAPSRK
jgi:hypothetical protein